MAACCGIDTLYYDGLCPLCCAEVRLLRRIQRGGLVLADIHQQPECAGLPSREQLLRTLHLCTEAGAWLTGVEATVQAWSHTGRGWLFRPLLWPGFAVLSRWGYSVWAQRRYRRRYACNVCVGGED